MCDGDKLLCSLTEASAAQVGDAVLGDNVVNIVLTCGADCARSEDGLDLAYRAALCGGGEGDEALAALGLACASDIVDLAARAGHMLGTDRLCADLAEEVDLESRIDGDHIVILADDGRVVYIVNRQHLDAGVIVYVIVNTL